MVLVSLFIKGNECARHENIDLALEVAMEIEKVVKLVITKLNAFSPW